jgi:hypothetical protein
MCPRIEVYIKISDYSHNQGSTIKEKRVNTIDANGIIYVDENNVVIKDEKALEKAQSLYKPEKVIIFSDSNGPVIEKGKKVDESIVEPDDGDTINFI